jgi:sec-independent protein translocase protein TatA
MLSEIFGPDLLIVVIVIAVVVFGGAAIPKLARNLGSAKKEFEKGIRGDGPAGVTGDGTGGGGTAGGAAGGTPAVPGTNETPAGSGPSGSS